MQIRTFKEVGCNICGKTGKGLGLIFKSKNAFLCMECGYKVSQAIEDATSSQLNKTTAIITDDEGLLIYTK